MSPIRQRVQGLLVAALLFVPLVLKGHSHPDHASRPICLSCIAARYTPTTAAPNAPVVQTVVVVVPVPSPPEPRVATEFHTTPTTGRSPPFVVSAVA